MSTLVELCSQYGDIDCRDLSPRKLEQLRDGLKSVTTEEVSSAEEGRSFIDLLRKFREAVAENAKLNGSNYPKLLNSLLSVGEDGLYSNSLRFIFELIQNVDDCEFRDPDDCRLDMHFRFNEGEIILSYNEVGFTPFNVFAITGIAEAAKNVTAAKDQIGEKGIGFKSVFGVANKVLIRSGWFSFELYKENFTIPVAHYSNTEYYPGTQMTLYVPGKAQSIYGQIKQQYCRKDALFSKNPLLFLNKLTTLKMYFDSWRCMEFCISSKPNARENGITREDDIVLSVNLHDYENGAEVKVKESIRCARYSYPIVFTKAACRARYGQGTAVGGTDGKRMMLQAVLPYPESINTVGRGGLYSFLPTQLKFTVPIVCHVPFKLDASREFVDPQDNNLWFIEASKHLSELMDYVFSDWCHVVENDIISYLPSLQVSLFARNNGKEICLSGQKVFSGEHFLEMPLFKSIHNDFVTNKEVFCFDENEDISEPEQVYCLLDINKALFIPPVNIKPALYGISIEKNALRRLFDKALSASTITAEAITLLDRAEYKYEEDQIPTGQFSLTLGQIGLLLKHEKLGKIFKDIAIKAIKKKQRPQFRINPEPEATVSDILYEGFDPAESPRQIEDYLKFSNGKCACVSIDETLFLPCQNGVVLSKEKPIASFAAFCYAVDQRDTFSIRIRLRQASERLNQYVEQNSGTASDFIRELRNIRVLVKESLGEEGYKSYIELIQKAGTDKKRFLQELLQNADDCSYSSGSIPSFKLSMKGNTVTTTYNETGFTRANIRSITAIGESTKNKLLTHDSSIGEKGVGFKSLFAVASKVEICSGDYAFTLADSDPTIPKLPKTSIAPISGTRMILTLKEMSAAPDLDDKSILSLVLCLRQLKSIELNGNHVIIKDEADTRTITINGKQYTFKKVVRPFVVHDQAALDERNNGSRVISPEQQIVCYVPGRNALSEYFLYNGLPTKHKISIPLVIDAPYDLTTSRETIEIDSERWNGIVREEMYQAILDVMERLKIEERSNILRFAKFGHQYRGTTHIYTNEISDCQYINAYPYADLLSQRPIIPTFDRNHFAIMSRENPYRMPEAVRFLLEMLQPDDYSTFTPSDAIDVSSKSYDGVLGALNCKPASLDTLFPLIENYAELFIGENEGFRTTLYEYLYSEKGNLGNIFRRLQKLKIIPVYGATSSSVEYVSWQEEKVFVQKGMQRSPQSYYILAETVLSKANCEAILDVNINEMNEQYAKHQYQDSVVAVINQRDNEYTYRYLLREFKNGNLIKYDIQAILKGMREKIALRNESGDIVSPLFWSSQPAGYFATDLIRQVSAHKECVELARYIGCGELSDVRYEDITWDEQLIDDDMESLLDDYLKYGHEIIMSFYRAGLVSEEMLERYELGYLALGREDNSNDYEHAFPGKAVANYTILRAHVAKLWRHPSKIVSVKVERTIQKVESPDGKIFEMNSNETRQGALNTYSPEGEHGICFCQMCQRVRPNKLIEVNNIEYKPSYYFPQMRIALCLYCSKKFEELRYNTRFREEFLMGIVDKVISEDDEIIDVPIGPEEIRFTAQHLAEIQEILKLIPEK